MCGSKNYLIENQYALLKVVAQGGFGRIFKAIEIETQTVVAIKERKSENLIFVKAWEKEIFSLKLLLKTVPNLPTSRLISVLDDTKSNLKSKYLVMGVFFSKFFFFVLFSTKKIKNGLKEEIWQVLNKKTLKNQNFRTNTIL